MIQLDVYFNDDINLDGQALLEENLITGQVVLRLKEKLFISEIRYFIDKATELLKKRYDVVNVDIHWDSIKSNVTNGGK